MFPTFNHAIRTDVDGMAFLDLEVQVVFNNQKVLFRYTLPATSNFKFCDHLANNIGEDIKPDNRR